MDHGFDYDQGHQGVSDHQGSKKKRVGRQTVFNVILSVAVLLSIAFIVIGFIGNGGSSAFGKSGTLTLNVSKREVLGAQPMSTAETVAAVEKTVVAIGYDADCGSGSGVIISNDGFIVTNNHVVSGYDRVYVSLYDGTVYQANVLATDWQTDIALIKIEPQGELSAAVFGNSDAALKGEDVIVIGNPTGELKGSVTKGVISHNSRTLTIQGSVMELIQTDASVNPGNSGGGMFNEYGELIGIVNSKIVATNVEAIGFAIPSNTVLEIVEDLMEKGYVSGRPTLGIEYTKSLISYWGGYSYEYIVTESKYYSEIKEGDKIVSIAGVSLNDYTAQQILYPYKVGDEIEIVVKRNSETLVFKLVLKEYAPN